MNNDQEDELISRVIDCECGDSHWDQFVMRAESEPALWRDLAESQRDELGLSRAVAEAVAVANAVVAPEIPACLSPRRFDRSMRIPQWSGWAVAAVITIAALMRAGFPAQTTTLPGGNRTSIASPLDSAADAFKTYIEKGRQSGEVVGEVPDRVLVDTRPASSGKGYELLYLRQVLERTVVPDLYQINGQNEFGQPTLARYERPVRSSM